MVKKKKALKKLKVYCYYCEQIFKDESVLVQHQKAKHFKCVVCNKKMSTVIALSEHMLQMHQMTLSKVPNALKGRDSLELDIYGMENVPEDDKQAMKRKQNGLDPEEVPVVKKQKVAPTESGSDRTQAQSQTHFPGGVPPPFQQQLLTPYMQQPQRPGPHGPGGQMHMPPMLNTYGAPQWRPTAPGGGPGYVPPPFGNQRGFGHANPPGFAPSQPSHPPPHQVQSSQPQQHMIGAGPVLRGPPAAAPSYTLSAGPTASAPPQGLHQQHHPGGSQGLPPTPAATKAMGGATAGDATIPEQMAAFAAGARPGQATQQVAAGTPTTTATTTSKAAPPTPRHEQVSGQTPAAGLYYPANDISVEERRAAMAKYRVNVK